MWIINQAGEEAIHSRHTRTSGTFSESVSKAVDLTLKYVRHEGVNRKRTQIHFVVNEANSQRLNTLPNRAVLVKSECIFCNTYFVTTFFSKECNAYDFESNYRPSTSSLWVYRLFAVVKSFLNYENSENAL